MSRHENIRFLCKVVEENTNIKIDPPEENYIRSKISKRLLELKLSSLDQYSDYIRKEGRKETDIFVDYITNNTTHFFRDKRQYDWLMKDGFAMLTERSPRSAGRLTIWSAASSSGQELYSALMCACEWMAQNQQSRQIEGLGTDISKNAIDKAVKAEYSRDEADTIPSPFKEKYVEASRATPGAYNIVSKVKSLARFKHANLVKFHGDGVQADVIMLRNVLIYFDNECRDRIVRNVSSRLKQGGLFFLGHSDSINAKDYGLSQVAPAIFVKGSSK